MRASPISECKAKRICTVDGVRACVNIQVNPPSQPNRVRRQVTPGIWIIVPVIVIVQAGLFIEVLARKCFDYELQFCICQRTSGKFIRL